VIEEEENILKEEEETDTYTPREGWVPLFTREVQDSFYY